VRTVLASCYRGSRFAATGLNGSAKRALTAYYFFRCLGWDDRLGNGWCYHSNRDDCGREARWTFAALVVRVCRDFARTLAVAGMSPVLVQMYEQTATSLSRRFVQHVKAIAGDSSWPLGLGVHAAANAINSGIIANASTIDMWMKNTLNDPVTICSWSPFNQYWILQALGNADRIEHAIASIKLCWGPMVELGNGCFWELSSPEWKSFLAKGDIAPTMPSYCHPWSSGVTAWLTHVHLGIEPLSPGYEAAIVTPYVSSRYPSVSGAVATRYGKISVNASLSRSIREKHSEGAGHKTATLRLTVDSPVQGFIGIRKWISTTIAGETCVLTGTSNNRTSVLVNGMETRLKSIDDLVSDPYSEDFATFLTSHYSTVRAVSLLFLPLPKAERVSVLATYRGFDCGRAGGMQSNASPDTFPPFSKPHYPGTVSIDRKSHGNGLYKHGKDGFVLFGFDNGTDRSQLPGFIESVSVRQHGYVGWIIPPRRFVGTSPTAPAYLPSPNTFTNLPVRPRALGLIGHDYTAGSNLDASLVIDVKHSETAGLDGRNISLSLYCVANSSNRKQAIRVMDLGTLNVIAKTSLVTNHTNGVWWSVSYNGSVRLRIMNIDGIGISAVGFTLA